MVPTAASWAAAASPSLGELARAFGNMAGVVAERMAAGLSTPSMAVLAGTGRCLELYRQVLLVRCLLTWFPSVQWEQQPFSAMRALCDSFLRLFQRAAPPVFGNTLDVSSLLAMTALRILARLLTPSVPNGL
ncbi:unnamed protein product [Spirodela intermedia]|uniref:Uncharacterized protein n=1 Tax=Spirodela intermedia TaxID=51605 RepID=A0A7I8IKV2_SPIIN|nr:unnamed protein product [Spirodela intermedia]CAA6658511.1 unnamed protein product [Spirodela intermedia]